MESPESALTREQLEETLRILGETSELLARSYTRSSIADVITERITHLLQAQSCAIFELSADGQELLLMGAAGVSDDVLRDYQRFSIDTPLPVRDAVRSRAPVLLENLQQWREHYPSPPTVGEDVARAVLPLLMGEGVIGVITILFSELRTFSSAQRAFMMAVAHQCALALERVRLFEDRARLYEAEHNARLTAENHAQRTTRLQVVSSALGSAISRQEVAEAVLDEVSTAVLPLLAAIFELSEDGKELVCLGMTQADPAIQERYARYPLNTPSASRDAIEQCAPIFVRSRAEWTAKYPGAPTIDGANSWCVLPLVLNNQPIGALDVAFSEEREFDSSDVAFMIALASQGAVALERARLYEAERAARARAEKANAAKSQFLSIMSHELRTPLNAVIGYTELLLMNVKGDLNDQQRDQVERIKSSAWHQLGLIEEILSFARIEAGKEELRVFAADLNSLVLDVSELMRPQAERQGLELRTNIPDGPCVLKTDAAKVRQIVLNLLGNAVKFTKAGHVEVGVLRTPVDCVVYVDDTGPGIPAEKVESIWQPFTQLDQSDTREVGGTGLGLTIVQRLAELLGAGLSLDSTVGEGSRFELHLPI